MPAHEQTMPLARKSWYKVHMNERVKKLSDEIRKLSPEEQADLMHELLGLTSARRDSRIEKAWAKEALGRWENYKRGRVKTIPADEVFAKVGKRRNGTRAR